MRVLVVKLTSMGDALHVLPALTDLQAHNPKVVVDWMIEDTFAEIPSWHDSVDRVIQVSTRRWRKFSRANIAEFLSFWKLLRRERYDVVIDAQGLIKSAVFARFAKLHKGGQRAGFSGASIKESPAAKLYKVKIDVARDQHAVDRLRRLFAGVFKYSANASAPNFDLDFATADGVEPGAILLFHGTTWPTKHLPDQVWRDLVELANSSGYPVKVAWGSELEKKRAHWVVDGKNNAEVLAKSTLGDLAQELNRASGAIAVDTGLGHLAGALGVPCVSVYGSTDAGLTGTVGVNQLHMQSTYACSPCLMKNCPKLTDKISTPPCYNELSAQVLWQTLMQKLDR